MRLQRYKVFADAFNAGGDTWKDGAIADSGGVARPVIVSRIIGSDPKQTAGVEYDCLPGLGLIPALDTGGDAFYFPNQDDPEKTEAQLRMASIRRVLRCLQKMMTGYSNNLNFVNMR